MTNRDSSGVRLKHRHFRNLILTAGVLLSCGFVVLASWLARGVETDVLVRSSKAYSEAIMQFRAFYSDVIVEPLYGHPWVEVTEDYKKVPGSIPIPATMTLDLVDYINHRDREVYIAQVSDFPFPDRADRILTEFEQQALQTLRRTGDAEYHRTERRNGQLFLSYAMPVRLEESCVHCHNTHPQTPKSDWQAGDVRGIQVVRMPVAEFSSLQSPRLLIFSGLIFLALVIGILALLWMDGRIGRALRLAKEKSEALEKTTHALQQREFAMDQHSIISITNPDGDILYVNDRFISISGYSREELLGKNHRIINSKLHPPEFFQQMWDTIKAGRVWHGEIRNSNRHGHYYWVAATIVPFLDRSGKPEQYISIRTDITHQKQLEQNLSDQNTTLMQLTTSLQEQNRQILEAKRTAEAASEAKSRFLANMSHEIRTPMNGILGMTQLALETQLNATQRDYLQLVHSSASSLMILLNDILDFSRIEAGKLLIEKRPFLLGELLSEPLKALAIRAHGKQLVFVQDIGDSLPIEVIGDTGRIRQILNNLCDNAIKFTQQGEVTLVARWHFDQAHQGHLRLEVRDTGIGIATDKQQAIFAAFTQADASTTREYGGTGLGLSICARLLELMGGQIGISSQPGQGSCFWFELPLQLTEHQPRTAVISQSCKLLVFDPHPVNRQSLCLQLKHLGADIQSVSSLAELEQHLQKPESCSGLVIKHQPPDFNALDWLEQQRQHTEAPHLPILLLSPLTQQGDNERCRQLQISSYLTWPPTDQELVSALQQKFISQGNRSISLIQIPDDFDWQFSHLDQDSMRSLLPSLLQKREELEQLRTAAAEQNGAMLQQQLNSLWSNMALLKVEHLEWRYRRLLQMNKTGKMLPEDELNTLLNATDEWLQQLLKKVRLSL